MDLPDRADPASWAREQGVTPWFGDHWLRIDSVGEEPWEISQPKYMALFSELIQLGWRHATHTPNNDVLGRILDTYEAIDRTTPLRDKRLVVEHIPTVTAPLMDRLAKLGIIVSTNIAGYQNFDLVAKRSSEAEAARQTPVRELLDHHLVVVSGFDYNGPNPETMAPNNPFIYLYFYVSRKTSDGRVIAPQEKITRQEALRIATNNNAFVTWEDKVKGSIEAGKLADFLVLSGDFMTAPEDDILKLHPLATYVGGRKVYSAPNQKDVY
jgi:predicted amidohydrolase YtcJ